MTSGHLRRLTKLEGGAAWSSWRQYEGRPVREWPSDAIDDWLVFVGWGTDADRAELLELGFTAEDVDHIVRDIEAHKAKRAARGSPAGAEG